jgi:hypothetical protein
LPLLLRTCRRWRNGVAAGALPDGTIGGGRAGGGEALDSSSGIIRMSAGELFKLDDNEGSVDQQEQKQQQLEAQQS